MARYSKEKEKEFIARIRAILVRKTGITLTEIVEVLASSSSPIKLDKNYVNRLVNKIRKERAERLNYYTVNTVLANFQDEVEQLKDRLWAIINNPTSTNKEKTSAIKELRESSKVLFDKMFDAGIFERQLGKLKTEDKLNSEDEDLLKRAINYATERSRVGEDKEQPSPEEKTS